jgi:indole-3-glycerol phosphate synthase
MNILEEIVAQKKEEMLIRKIMVPVDQVVNSRHFDEKCLSLSQSILDKGKTGIIAEFKRKSPSKGFINQHADVSQITRHYTASGASGLSVLTDNAYFGGSTDDLILARENNIPILRKEFIIDPYQILTTKALGADAILLIAAILTPRQVKDFAGSAKKLGLEVLLELHDESELGHICDEVDLVGINNRNLKTFKVDIGQSISLCRKIPAGKIKIAESGISSPEVMLQLKEAGFDGFLIGERFMQEEDPGKAFENFIKQLN